MGGTLDPMDSMRAGSVGRISEKVRCSSHFGSVCVGAGRDDGKLWGLPL